MLWFDFHIYLCDNVVQHAFNMSGLGLFCFACWFILDDVPTRQAKAAKGNLTVPAWKPRKISLGIYWTTLLAATSRAGPTPQTWDPVPAIPLCWDCHARACCWPILKTVKSCTSTHTPITIHHLRYQHPSEAHDAQLRTSLCMCTCACCHHRCTTAFLSIGLLQGEAIKVFPLTTLHWGEEGGFPRG